MIRSHEEEGKLQVDPDNKHQTFYMNKIIITSLIISALTCSGIVGANENRKI